MGAGASAQVVQEHLDKQEVLIQRLTTAVGKQSAVLAGVDGEPAQGEWDKDDMDEDINGLQRATIELQQLPSRPNPELDPEEEEEPDAEWGTPEEAAGQRYPWLLNMAPPTGWAASKERDDRPTVRLELDYVYGGPKGLLRNCVAARDENTLIYPAGAVGVVHDVAAGTQVFMQGSGSNEGHSDAITSLAYHPATQVVATGQQGKGMSSAILVWSAKTGELKAKLAGFHTRGVVALGFSDAGTQLASAGIDDAHSVAVHDWELGQAVATAACGSRVLALRYEPGSSSSFVTVGVDAIWFWSCADGALARVPAKLGSAGRVQPFTSIGFTGGNTLIGTAMGQLYVIGPQRTMIKSVDAHNGAVACIAELRSEIVTGGRDGFVSVWDETLQRVRQWDMSKSSAGGVNRVRSLTVQGESLVVLCANATIYRVSEKGGAEPLASNHFGDLSGAAAYGELWALAPDPKGARFATVCDDATLRVWDSASRRCVAKADIGATTSGGPARALCWSPDGKFIVAGFMQGSFAVFDAATLDEQLRLKKHKRRVQCAAFSPCSKFFAVACADSTVDVYDTADFRRVTLLKDNTAVVMQLDWCKHSKYIRTTSQDYELLHFDVGAGTVVPNAAEAMKDVQWATASTVLGWDVQGIWASRDFDASEVNAVSRSGNEKYLATADTYGRVKLFNYPCVGGGFNKAGRLVRRPRCHWVAPSPCATNVAWSSDDQYVYSCGGGDLSVFQWKVVAEKA